MMSMRTIDIFCLKTIEFQITAKKKLVMIFTDTGEMTVKMQLWIS